MSAGSVHPFDNDHASDFSDSVIHASDPSARHDLFAITFGAFMDMPDAEASEQMADGYELPMIIEEVLASAAYVADGATGDTRWITVAEARGVDPVTYELAPLVELGEIDGHLIVSAYTAVVRVLRLMRAAGISAEWMEPSLQIKDTLREAMHD